MVPLARILATVAYVGYLPIAPGTWGSLAGLLLLAGLRWAGVSAVGEAAVLVGLLVVGIWSADVTGRAMGEEDPGPVVMDEVVGMLLTLFWIPLSWPAAVLGFLLFRLFDIIKPFPARQCERLPGGWGVMLDDVMAGVYGWVVMRLALAALPGWLA